MLSKMSNLWEKSQDMNKKKQSIKMVHDEAQMLDSLDKYFK